MVAGIICSDFRAQEEEICYYVHIFTSICHEVMGLCAVIIVFKIRLSRDMKVGYKVKKMIMLTSLNVSGSCSHLPIS